MDDCGYVSAANWRKIGISQIELQVCTYLPTRYYYYLGGRVITEQLQCNRGARVYSSSHCARKLMVVMPTADWLDTNHGPPPTIANRATRRPTINMIRQVLLFEIDQFSYLSCSAQVRSRSVCESINLKSLLAFDLIGRLIVYNGVTFGCQ